MASTFYRVNDKPNQIDIDLDNFEHQFDPLGVTHDALVNCALIRNLGIDPTFVISKIVSYVGYIESSLHLISSSRYGTYPWDIEQCFFIKPPSKSKYNYTLKSFACDVILGLSTQLKWCATLVLFDETKVKQNKEDILWQSQIYDNESTVIFEGDENDNKFIHVSHKDLIVKFDNLYVKLKNDKLYLMRIDIVEGQSGCRYDARRDKTKTYFVKTNGHLYKNRYSMRTKHYDDKLYELVLV
eukprot:462793_1